MISTDNGASGVNGFADSNDFITLVIPDSVSKPYIKFYDEDGNYINNATGSTASSNGLHLAPDNSGNSGSNNMTLTGTAYTCVSSTDTTNNTVTYKVRIPKNAQSFSIHSGSSDGDAIPLVQNIRVDGNRQIVSEGGTPITNYRHAGTIFTLNSSLAVTSKALSSFTVPGQEASTLPLTDNDYVYFMDTNPSTFADGGKVFAYFFGGADGEYKAWPGVEASKASAAVTTYTDNSGRTVYMFRIPPKEEGSYPYVMFTDGSDAYDRKITQAYAVSGGSNYVLNPTISDVQYGNVTHTTTLDTAKYTYAAPAAAKAQASGTNVAYSVAGTNNYIYFNNDGTSLFIGDDRYLLDEVHVVFYDAGGQVIGNSASGYYPEKISDGNIYRIQVPDNAKYFRITNGVGKGADTEANNFYRQSERKAVTVNAIYKFVDNNTDASKVWNNASAPAVSQNYDDHDYYLTITNRLTSPDEILPTTDTVDIKLAVIVTKADGTQDYIKWLRPNPSGTGIDTTYLDSSNATWDPVSGTGTKKTTVKVIKQGDYYWKEVAAPQGYTIPTNNTVEFTLPGGTTNSTITDPSQPVPSVKNKLVLKKTVAGAEDTTTEFIYKVTLSSTTLDLQGYNFPTRVMTATNGTILTAAPYDENYYVNGTTSSYVFYIKVKAVTSNFVEINNIPAGTAYSVEEVDIPDTWYRTSSSPVEGTISSTANTPSEASFTNRKTSSLTLKKTLESSDVSTYGNKSFTFTVNLTSAPATIGTLEYAFGSISGVTTDGATVSRNSDTLTVTLKHGQQVTISGIPVGTTYQVTETSPGEDWSTGYKIDSETAVQNLSSTPATGKTISASGNTVEFTNDYSEPLPGSLTLEKAVSGQFPTGVDSNTWYVFNVSLSNATTRDKITAGSGVDYAVTDSSGTAITGTTAIAADTTFKVKLKAGSANKVTICNLPRGTTYTVVEDSSGYYRYNNTVSNGYDTTATAFTGTGNSSSNKYSVNSGTPTSTNPGAIGSGEAHAVEVTNAYPAAHKLTLSKSISGDYKPADANSKSYTYHVTLSGNTSGIDLSKYTIQVNNETLSTSAANPVNYDTVAYDASTKTYTFNVKNITAAANGSVEITGIPDGTTYSIYEVTTGFPACITSGNDSTNPIESANTGLTADAEETITNTYKTGKIKLSKVVSPSGAPDIIKNGSYSFFVTITAPAGVDLTKYISNFASTNAAYSGLQPTTSGDVTTYTFTHTFTGGNNDFTIDNVPIGTSCTIYETGSNTDYLTTTNRGATNAVSILPSMVAEYNGQDSSIAKASITNTYNAGTLQLKKTVSGSGNEHTTPGEYYFFEVELTEPSGVSFNLPVSSGTPPAATNNPYGITGISGSDISSITYNGSNKYTIIKNISANGTVSEITGLPYGTGYKVTEVYRPNGTSPFESVSNDPNHPHVSSNNGTSGTISSASVLFNIENLYRKITLTKTDVKTDTLGQTIELDGAAYYLLRLENASHFNSTTGTPDQTMTDLFAGATALDAVSGYYNATTGVSGPYTTGDTTTHTWDTGEIVVDDSMISGGLTPGWYFFFETAAPSGYKIDNSLSGKIIHITATSEPQDYNYEKTYTNVYKTGSLELEKELAPGTDPDTNPQGTTSGTLNKDEEFTYTVVLEAPSGITLGTETGKYAVGISNYIEQTAPSPTYGTANSKSTCTYVVKVRKNAVNKVRLTSIPYGTTYTVTESSTMPTVTGDASWQQLADTNNTGTTTGGITDSSVTGGVVKNAKITNGLTGQLKIDKTFTNAPSNAGSMRFTFTVTLAPPSGKTIDWGKYTYTASNGSTLTLGGTDNNVISGITVTGNGDVTISGIPYGATCTVAETSTGDYTKSITGNDKAIGNTLQTTTVNNTFNSYSLTLKKSIVNYPANAATTKANKTYLFRVRLTSGTFDWENVTITGDTTYTKENDYPSGGMIIPVKEDTNGIVIGGLKNGTGYQVDEVTSVNVTIAADSPYDGYTAAVTADHGTVSGNVASGSLSADNKSHTVTATNTYKKTGTLKLKKIVDKNNTSTVPSNAKYYFTVTLTPMTINGVTVCSEPYVIKQDGSDIGIPASGIFTVQMTPGTEVSLSGIPDGVSYTVAETSSMEVGGNTITNPIHNGTAVVEHPSGTGWTTSYQTGSANATAIDVDNDNKVEIKNTYLDVGKLSISKNVAPSTLPTGLTGIDTDTTYTIHVDLTAPSGVSFDNYAISYKIGSTVTNVANADKNSFDISLKGGQTAEISNLPFETRYNVTETSGSEQTSSAVVNDTTSQTPITVSGGTTTYGKIDEAASTVNVTNTYYPTGTLTLSKVVSPASGTYPQNKASAYIFHVVLSDVPTNATLLGSGAAAGAKGYKIEKNTGASGAYVSVGTNPKVFDVEVPAGGSVIIRGIPEGTKYEVTETDASKAGTISVNTSLGDNSKTIGGSNDTVQITNTYPSLGSLVLSKSYADGTNETDNALTEFVYKVVLTAPSGSASDYLSTYNASNVNTSGSYAITSSGGFVSNDGTSIAADAQIGAYGTDSGLQTYTFYVKVKKGTNVTIGSIPQGVSYAVEETIPVGWIQTAKSGETGTISSTASTASFTNAKKGDLNLVKALECVSGTGHDSKPFQYHVVLKAPTGMVFTKADSGNSGQLVKLYIANTSNGVVNEIVIDPETITYGSEIVSEKVVGNDVTIGIADSRSTATFDIHVSKYTARKLKGLPFGTDYTVTEITTVQALPAAPTGTEWKKLTSTDPGGKIGTDSTAVGGVPTNTATITNALTGKMDLTKTLAGSIPTGAYGKDFTFKVTLEKSGITWNDYANVIKVDSSSVSLSTVEGAENENKRSFTTTISVPSDDSDHSVTVNITGLPYGATYTVEETDPEESSNVSYVINEGQAGSTSDTAYTANGGSNTISGTTQTVKFTNTYPTRVSLTLGKSVVGAANRPSGVPESGNNPYYTLLVIIKQPDGVDMSHYPVSVTNGITMYQVTAGNEADTTETYNNIVSGRQFAVKLQHGQTFVVSGLPENTTYRVVESANSKAQATSVINQKSSDTAIAFDTVNTITNKYEVGSLKLLKTRTGTPPPNPNTEFTFHVKLDRPYDAANNNYAELTSYTIKYRDKDNVEQPVTDAGYGTKNYYEFDVVVPYNETGITIEGIPYGTQYTVSENYTAYTGVQSNSGNVTGKIGDSNAVAGLSTATINNVYSGNVLTLTKVLGANAANYGVTNAKPFTYKVKFRHATAATLAASPLTVTGTGNSNIQNPINDQVYDITVYPGTNVTISGMPADTAFEVYEVTTGLPNGTTQSATVNGTAHTVNSVTEDGTSDHKCTGSVVANTEQTVAITNTYGDVGTLTLNKEMASGTTATDANKEQEFVYEVTLNAPTNAKLNQSAYTVTAGKTISVTQTPATGLATQLKYTVKVSKNTPVEISGLPYGTEFSVVEKQSGTYSDGGNTVNYMPDGWKYIKEEYGTETDVSGTTKHYIGEVVTTSGSEKDNTYTAYNAQINTLTLSKDLASGSNGKDSNNDFILNP